MQFPPCLFLAGSADQVDQLLLDGRYLSALREEDAAPVLASSGIVGVAVGTAVVVGDSGVCTAGLIITVPVVAIPGRRGASVAPAIVVAVSGVPLSLTI